MHFDHTRETSEMDPFQEILKARGLECHQIIKICKDLELLVPSLALGVKFCTVQIVALLPSGSRCEKFQSYFGRK